MVIALARPFMRVYDSQGRGNCFNEGGSINFMQKIDEVASNLPCLPENPHSSGILVVKTEGDNIGECRDLRIRKAKVHEALASNSTILTTPISLSI